MADEVERASRGFDVRLWERIPEEDSDDERVQQP
jgi:hypothetical protein